MSKKDSSLNAIDGDAEPTVIGLGQTMRLAREKMGVSLEEMSSHLRLTETRIRALEEERYDLLPEPAFVKGYIRGYARVAEVDSDAWINQYHQMGYGDVALKQIVSDPSSVNQESSSAMPMMVVAFIVLLVAGGAGAWFFSSMPSELGDTALEGETEEVRESNNLSDESVSVGEVVGAVVAPKQDDVKLALNEGATQLTEASSGLESEVLESADTITASLSSGDGSNVLSELDAVVDSTTSLAESDVNSEAAGDSSGTDNADESVSEVDPTVKEPIAEPEGDGSVLAAAEETASVDPVSPEASSSNLTSEKDLIELSTDFKSWIEIRDATGERLMFGMLRANNARRLSGTAPFNVFLGNAPAVQMTINGTPIERPRFNAQKNTARFLVSSNGDVTN